VDYLGFLNEILSLHQCQVKTVSDFDLNALESCAKGNAAYNIYSAAQKIMAAVKDGSSMKEAWNEKAGIELVESARAHTTLFTYRAMLHRIQQLQEGKTKAALSRLCALYVLHKLLQHPLGLIESSYVTAEQFKMMKLRKEEILEELRPDAVGLVDAFQYPDNSLKSAIGGYDGNPYETMWDWVKNKNVFNKSEVMDGVKEYLLTMKYIKRPPILKPKL